MDQLTLFNKARKKLISPKEASEWASKYLNRRVTVSNISYLIQYGRIKKFGNNGNPLLDIDELKVYYDSYSKEEDWKKKLGEDLNWNLSFTEYKESERTKHVHRLHPYKGKFIPQLVEYFIDTHIDNFKKTIYFHHGDVILDPFCESGTTLVQANELGIHAIGIDISKFNTMISNVKIRKYNINLLQEKIRELTFALLDFQKDKNNVIFEKRLLEELYKYNSKYFPSPEFRRKVIQGRVNEKEYSIEKEKEFLQIYDSLIKKYNIKINQIGNGNFLDNWFVLPVREEIDFLFDSLKQIKTSDIKKILAILLSRTIRSCRATTHADLATLKEPVKATYYCRKHGKICKPIFSILGWWRTYSADTINRLMEFNRIRTNSLQYCLTGDARTINIHDCLKTSNRNFAELLKKQKISGIFSSPPYVGLIDYHEQHAYAYDLFGFKRKDDLEIGPLFKGQGKDARDAYIVGIASVLSNSRKYMKNDFDIFLVANDKFNLYPQIAKLSNMKIINKYKRPVLNRVEKDRSAYAETIFHLKGN